MAGKDLMSPLASANNVDPGEDADAIAASAEAAGLIAAMSASPMNDDEGQEDSAGNTVFLSGMGHAEIAELEPGTTVHRYVVLRTLGRGGMGIVYLAFDPELERQVALKLLTTRSEGISVTTAREVRTRMLREAQAMAKLSHPNVLPVYDVGSYAGAIFMATEYVEGGTLREWSTSQPRSWQEVVEVFIAAGRGLAAAHAAGLIHRDFKPQNVMIGTDGQVRVMDFGLVRNVSENVDTPSPEQQTNVVGIDAKRASSSALDTELTDAGTCLGTPAYMAPEQHRGHNVDARADQFSFCVALYESLYGVRPFPSKRDDMLQACENGRLATPTIKPRVPTWLRKGMLQGLSFRPEDRFAAMEPLLKILSRDPRKRWQWAMVTSTAVLGFVVGGTSWARHLSDQAAMCSGGPAQMAPVWSAETKERAKASLSATGVPYAEDTWNRVESLLDAYASEWMGVHRESCEATHVRKEQSEALMDLRMRCLQRRLWDVNGMMKTFSQADATTVKLAVETATRLTPPSRCSDAERLQAQATAPDDPEARARVDTLSQQLADAKALGSSGKTKEGLESTQSILEQAKALGYGPLQAESSLVLSRLRTDAVDPTAEAGAMETILLAEANDMDEVRAQATVLLVEIVGHLQMRPQEAMRWGKLAEAVLGRLGGDPGLEAELLNGLGHAARISSDFVRARELGLQQVAVLEQLERVDSRLGWGLGLVGSTARKLGEYDEARAYLERAVQSLEQTLGARHPQLADVLIELGRTYLLQGDYAGAHATLKRAQAIVEESLGRDGVSLYAQVLLHRGRVFLHEGHYEAAQEHIEDALARYEGILPVDHPQLAYTRVILADVYRRQAGFDKAQAQLEPAIQNLEKATQKLSLALALTTSGRTSLDRGDAGAAVEPLERALSIMDSTGKNVRPKERAETRFALGMALWASGRDPGRGHSLVSQARDGFAQTGIDQAKDLAEAENWLHQHLHP